MMPDESNPLLTIQFQIPFDRIRADHVEPAIDVSLDEARKRIDEIAAPKTQRTFDNTMVEYDRLTERLEYAMCILRHMESAATTPAYREANNAVQPKISEFASGIPLHEGLWRALREYADTPDAAALTGPRKRFLAKTIEIFRRHGADLDAAGKARLNEINVELAQLTTKFAENVLDATNEFDIVITNQADLAGLPPSAVAAARQSAERKNIEGWRFTLHAPSYVPLLTYLDNRAIREQVWRAFNTRAASGKHDNRELIVRILAARQAKARLLGFADFADLVLEDRMAHNGARAQDFLNDLRSKTRARFAAENAELDGFCRQTLGDAAVLIPPWDVAYLAEKLRKALYDFDEEEVRPYFRLENVVSGMYELVEKLFGIRVTEITGVPVWDTEVKCYAIRDSSGEQIGAFYADWFPRENKRQGAWMGVFLTGGPGSGGFEPNSGVICGNLTPPVGETPSLLTHREVETIFHEFGHLLHHCLSRVEIRSMAGTSVAWDFVELPSQIMENWCWERASLDLFARHWQTGEAIPEELFAKMTRARNFRSANAQMRQLSFGFLDLALHRQYSIDNDGDVIRYARRVMEPFSPAPLPEDYAMVAGFTHLFADPVGYGAGYYSYKWAEVLDADAFSRFLEEGIFSREVGLHFRDCILSRGDSEDPAELYRQFMGRDPDPNALLVRLGLA